MKFKNENDCREHLMNKLVESGYTVASEIPFYMNSVDIVAHANGRVIAIEVKLTNYNRALRQARNHCLFATDGNRVSFNRRRSRRYHPICGELLVYQGL